MFSGYSFGTNESGYAAEADKSLLVIVQIESKGGVANVEEIAKVDGVDVLFVGESTGHIRAELLQGADTTGPFDLSKQLGVPFGSQEHEDAIAKVLKAAKAAGKIAAFFCELNLLIAAQDCGSWLVACG